MALSIERTPTRVAAVVASLLIGLLLPLSFAGPASAALSVSTDPIATLSTGGVLDLSAETLDLSNDVRNVTYVLHVPVGTSVTSVSYLLGSAPITTFSWVADDAPGTYDASILVTARHKAIVLAAFVVVSWPAGLQLPLTLAPVIGHTGQAMHIHLPTGLPLGL
ncbi:MAG: hypothetical protein ACRDIE_15410 [Chloroflexota bacterium]